MKSAGKSHLRASYAGSSRRSLFYQKARMRDLETAAKGSRTIDSFFSQTDTAGTNSSNGAEKTTEESEDETGSQAMLDSANIAELSDNDLNEEEATTEDELVVEGRMIKEIEEYLGKKGSETVSIEEEAKLQGVLQYLRLRQTGKDKCKYRASVFIASINDKTLYWGRCLVRWKKNKKIVLS